jgi:hypothetical protein
MTSPGLLRFCSRRTRPALSQLASAVADRPATTSSNRAGPPRSCTGVRSMMTVTNPSVPWRRGAHSDCVHGVPGDAKLDGDRRDRGAVDHQPPQHIPGTPTRRGWVRCSQLVEVLIEDHLPAGGRDAPIPRYRDRGPTSAQRHDPSRGYPPTTAARSFPKSRISRGWSAAFSMCGRISMPENSSEISMIAGNVPSTGAGRPRECASTAPRGCAQPWCSPPRKHPRWHRYPRRCSTSQPGHTQAEPP